MTQLEQIEKMFYGDVVEQKYMMNERRRFTPALQEYDASYL